MSMYNLIFGENKFANHILGALSLSKADCGRYRDAWVEMTEDGEYRIAVYTRNGGGNRQCWEEGYIDPESGACYCPGCIIEKHLPMHSLYISDEDDSMDSTYATVYFRLPENEEYADFLKTLARDPVNSSCKWRSALDDMKAGKDPELTDRLQKAFQPIFEKIESEMKGNKDDGSA